jgi:TP901 family phage tail tape measure protein
MSMLASIVIGAVLAPGFRATIGSAVAGMGEMQGAAAKMGQALADVGQAWASLHAIDQVKTIASDFEHRLMQAGITADMTNSQVAELRATLRGLSVPDKTNQDVNQLLDGFTALVSAGMKNETATAMLGAMGRAATATGAAMEDLAKTAFTLNDTLGIAPEDMAKSFDKLAFAGKQGQFELKNMARYFPTLGGSAKALGLQGAEAVATLGAGLQIAMKKAADPSEAANNMKNFLAKATAPETVKRFEEFGVDLQQTLMDAVASGQNPMEVLVAKIQELTGGNQFNVQKLFGDQQALDFIIPMLANLEKYKKLKAEIAGASGAVDTDFARMMETNKELTKGLSNEMLKLGEVVGHSLLPGMNSTIAVLTPVVGWLSNLAETSPKTTSAVVSLGTAVVLLPPVIRLATAAWGAYTGSLVALRPALVMAGTAFRAFSSSILFTPIGAAIAAIGVAAFLIIDN